MNEFEFTPEHYKKAREPMRPYHVDPEKHVKKALESLDDMLGEEYSEQTRLSAAGLLLGLLTRTTVKTS